MKCSDDQLDWELLTDKLVGRPSTRRSSIIDETALLDLEEVQGRLVYLCTVAVLAACQIVDHRAVVAIGPGAPLQIDRAAGFDGNGDSAWRCILVTSDVPGGCQCQV